MIRLALLTVLTMSMAACGGEAVDPNAPLTTWEERDVLWVEADDLKNWMDAGHGEDVVFIDNRNSFVYEEQHIEGARLVPTDQMPGATGSLPLNKWLVMYCT